MDRIDGMKTFVAAAEAGSFTTAAERLSISKKLVSKYIGQLEDQLKVRLMHRTTRRISLTVEGQAYYERIARILDEIDALETDIHQGKSSLRGLVRLSAPATFGEMYVQPLLRDFGHRHPDMQFDLHLSDQFIGLTEGGFDLAIRIGAMESSNLIVRKLASTRLWVVAAPAYVATNGTPNVPADLVQHSCIIDANMRNADTWIFGAPSPSQAVVVSGRFKVNSGRAARDLAIAGEGLALCPDYIVAEAVRDGRLQHVLKDYRATEKPIQAVYPTVRYQSSRIRALIDFLSAELPKLTNFTEND